MTSHAIEAPPSKLDVILRINQTGTTTVLNIFLISVLFNYAFFFVAATFLGHPVLTIQIQVIL